MPGSPQSDTPLSPKPPHREIPPSSESPASAGRSALEEPELEAALQLLVERAQYITGATGAALALPQGDEMVCHASAGSCAPAVGARLQVRSGLTGESIARRQILRCDNAETDPRVNLEACQALGIASIVVLPLLRRSGEVRGLFELFSDHPYAFEERDLVALERMAALTVTALDLAEQRHGSPKARPQISGQGAAQASPQGLGQSSLPSAKPSPQGSAQDSAPDPAQASVPVPPTAKPPEKPADSLAPTLASPKQSASAATPAPAITGYPVVPSKALPAQPPEPAAVAVPMPESNTPQSSPLPEAMLRIQKCVSCGFPVSEGRALCLDCEKKQADRKSDEKRPQEAKQAETALIKQDAAPAADASPAPVYEDIPAFLANSMPVEESWLSNHVNLLAILVLIAAILVAVVVFR
ncbi:MAG: GAF domain-containing protein [Terriglobales bacterium]